MKAIVATIILVFSSHSVRAQSTFQDLDFSDANPILNGSMVTVSSGLPGWTVYYGTVQQNNILYDSISSYPASSLDLFNTGGPDSYDVFFQSPSSLSVSMSQTGTIPENAKYLTFILPQGSSVTNLQVPTLAQDIDVRIGAQNISLVPVFNGSIWFAEGSIPSSLDGKTEQLSFSSVPGLDGAFGIDVIAFSPTAIVPEPPPGALIVVGGLLFARLRRWKSN